LPESVLQDAKLDSAKFTADFYRAMKKYIWADTLDGVREASSAEDRILYILGYLDGTYPLPTDWITADNVDGDAATEIADSVWAADTLATGDSSAMGNWQTLGGTTAISTADMAEIADSVWATGDSSSMGNWQTLGGTGGSGAAQTTVDSILSATGYVSGISLMDKMGGFGASDRAGTDSTLHTYLWQIRERIGKMGILDRAVSVDSALSVYIQQIREYQDSIRDDIGGIGGGTGANTCSLWVYDTDNSLTVSSIYVRANNASGADQGHARTNANGISVLNLDDGAYKLVIPMNSGYIQTTNPQSFTVSGNTNDTIEVTLFSPSAPAGDLCTVYNWIKDGSDNAVAGVTVTAKIPTQFWPVRYSGQAIQAIVSTKTDNNGKWELSVFPSSLILTDQADSASYWQFTAQKGSQKYFGDQGYKVTVPDSSTFKMVPDSQQ